MINDEDRAILVRLAKYLRPHLALMIGATFAMMLAAGAETTIPMLLKTLLDDGFSGKLNEKLWQAPLFLMGLALARSLSQSLANYLLSVAISAVLLKLRQQMFWRLLHARAQFFTEKTASTLINTVVFEVNNVLAIMGGLVINFVRDFLTVLGLIAYLIYLNWQLTLVIVAIFPIIAFFVKRIGLRLKKIISEQQNLTNQLAYITQEATLGHKIIKLNNGVDYEMGRFMARAKALNQFELKSAVTGGLNQPLTQLIASIALSIVLVIALMQSSTQGVTVGGFAAFVAAMMMVISPLKSVASINHPLQKGLVAAKMVFGMLDETMESNPQLEQPSHPQNIVRTKGNISFENVSFVYPNKINETPDLAKVTFEIKGGETVALVGPSGSGKTTLVNLIPRFFMPSSGQILLDGIRLNEWSLKSLRQQIAFVDQNIILFNDTIAANVAYGNSVQEFDISRIKQALDSANLSEFIKTLPNGIDTVVGMNANELSGGQRQRLAIARAIYKNASILILDEATSALDSESEFQVKQALERLMQGKTTIIIAHRLSTIENADRVLVVNHGTIAEDGTHETLLAKNGLYASLYRTQHA